MSITPISADREGLISLSIKIGFTHTGIEARSAALMISP
jgi:hypothetical protein